MIRSTPTPPFAQIRRKRWRTNVLAADLFQRKYVLFFASIGLFLALVGGGVCWYLINYNFKILIQAGLLNSPKMVDTLERELRFANGMILSTFLGVFVFLIFSGMRITHKIVAPILIIQNHIRELSKGNLKGAEVHLRKTDEFLDFADSINYLVASIRAQTQRDLQNLTNLKPDDRNKDVLHIWEQMMEEKKCQLEGTTSSESGPSPSSRRAS